MENPRIVSDRTGSLPLALNPTQAAEALGIGRRLLWSKTNSGEIPHVRIGKRILYPVDALNRWLSDQAATPHRRGKGVTS